MMDRRDPRSDLRPWLQRLPIPVVFVAIVLLYVPALIYGACLGVAAGTVEAHGDVLSILRRFWSRRPISKDRP